MLWHEVDVRFSKRPLTGVVCWCDLRASAEEALQRLHQTVIGTQAVRLSWGRSPGNKQTTDVSVVVGVRDVVRFFWGWVGRWLVSR